MLARVQGRRQRGMVAIQVLFGAMILGIVIGGIAVAFSSFLKNGAPNYSEDLAQRVALSEAERVRATTMYDANVVQALKGTGTKSWQQTYTVASNLSKTATITTTAMGSSLAIDVTVDSSKAHVTVPLAIQSQMPNAMVQ